MNSRDMDASMTASSLPVSPIELPPLADAPSRQAGAAMPGLAATAAAPGNPLHGIRTRLTVVLGSVDISVGELLGVREQQVLRLDRSLDQPVDVMLEGQVIARGVLVAAGDDFGVRITELPRPLTP
jgi:flagellar motor switch protein FliN/FliY